MLSQQGGTFRAVERGPGPGLDAARGLASKIQKYLLRSAKLGTAPWGHGQARGGSAFAPRQLEGQKKQRLDLLGARRAAILAAV